MRIKTLVFTVAFLSISFLLFAEAPELKTVMPNSYKKLNRLNADAEKIFLESHQKIIAGTRNFYSKDEQLKDDMNNVIIYSQTVADNVFYRAVFSESDKTDFSSPNCKFVQSLIFDDKELMIGTYNCHGKTLEDSKYVYFYMFDSIEVSETSGGKIGLMFTTLYVPSDENKNRWIKQIKNQFYGDATSYYFLLESLNAREKKSSVQEHISGGEHPIVGPGITISATACLVENTRPLFYSLQSAFDNDTSTSWVENTEDDLMRIMFMIYDTNLYKVTAFAIVNGYAQNSKLYYENNHVKNIWLVNDTQIELKMPFSRIKEIAKIDAFDCPEKIGYTICNFPNKLIEQPDYGGAYMCFNLIVHSIYDGAKYNDTCISDINVKIDEKWLFGYVNE
jgi:hypothetical protein